MDDPPREFQDLHFPCAGLDRSLGFHAQPNRDIGGGVYSRSSAGALNVRAFEATAQRRRGGSRAGWTKLLNARVANATWVVQHLQVVVGSGYDPPGGGDVQASQSGRVVTLVAVSQGQVFATTPGGTSWSQAANATGETPPLNYTGVLQSAVLNQRVWFADGTNYCYYDPATHTVYRWQASAGTLPFDSAGNTPLLICRWRGSIVLSGLLLDQQNWFMSRLGDPTDFNYKPASFSAAQAVSGNNAPRGLVGDKITALIPASDDVLIFGCDHEIWAMRGHPNDGGQIDQISKSVGMAWATAWCQDPEGAVYFLSNQTGVYRMEAATATPVRIGRAIEQDLEAINTGENVIHMQWDHEFQGLKLWVTPAAAPGATTHYFWDQRTGGWWPDAFGDTNLDPLCSAVYDGNLPTDRKMLTGCWDGYVRFQDRSAVDDDGTAISSYVFIGPILTRNFDDITLRSIQTVLASVSGSVTWSVHVGATAEAALAAPAVRSGTFPGGRSLTFPVEKGGHAVYLKLSSTNRWAMEWVRVLLTGRGLVRMRAGGR